MSSSGSSFQAAKLDANPNHRHILKHDMTLNSSSFLLFQNDLVMCGRMAKMLHFSYKCNLFLFLSILQGLSGLSPEDFSVFPADWSPARGCSGSWCPLCFILPVSSGHRPQQSRRAKRCRKGFVHLCLTMQGTRKETEEKTQVQQGHHVFDSEKKNFSLLPCGPPFFPTWFFYPQWCFWGH